MGSNNYSVERSPSTIGEGIGVDLSKKFFVSLVAMQVGRRSTNKGGQNKTRHVESKSIGSAQATEAVDGPEAQG